MNHTQLTPLSDDACTCGLQWRKDAIEAVAIGMAFMISHLGAVSKFTDYQKKQWDRLMEIAKGTQQP